MAKNRPSELEELYAKRLREAGIRNFKQQFKAIPYRKFLWDFAWVKQKLLVEIQGGIFQKGAHSTGAGIERDMTKLNLATLNGYRCLQFSRRMIEDGSAVEITRQVLSILPVVKPSTVDKAPRV
jgi:very-short-patch-repair endonuclease